METKYCPHCNETKEVSEFYRDKSTKSGYKSWCRICHYGDIKRRKELKKEETSASWVVQKVEEAAPRDRKCSNYSALLTDLKHSMHTHELFYLSIDDRDDIRRLILFTNENEEISFSVAKYLRKGFITVIVLDEANKNPNLRLFFKDKEAYVYGETAVEVLERLLRCEARYINAMCKKFNGYATSIATDIKQQESLIFEGEL